MPSGLDIDIRSRVGDDVTMSMQSIYSLHELLFDRWPDTTGAMMTCCRIWPAAPHGCDPGSVAFRFVEWAMSVGLGSYTKQISQEPCLLKDALLTARDAIVAERRKIADRFVTYPATCPAAVRPTTADLVAELGWAWWRWEMPQLRVVQVGHEWDTMTPVWHE